MHMEESLEFMQSVCYEEKQKHAKVEKCLCTKTHSSFNPSFHTFFGVFSKEDIALVGRLRGAVSMHELRVPGVPLASGHRAF